MKFEAEEALPLAVALFNDRTRALLASIASFHYALVRSLAVVAPLLSVRRHRTDLGCSQPRQSQGMAAQMCGRRLRCHPRASGVRLFVQRMSEEACV